MTAHTTGKRIFFRYSISLARVESLIPIERISDDASKGEVCSHDFLIVKVCSLKMKKGSCEG